MTHTCRTYLLVFGLLPALSAAAQDSSALATLVQKLPKAEAPNLQYVADYHKDLTLRFFSGRRFYQYGLYDKGFAEQLTYRPNTPLSIGAGFNYRVLGINIGFSPDILNNSGRYGRTGFFDVQTHLYGRKLNIDLAYLHYKGFYSNSNAFLGMDPGAVYLRPDLRFNHFGFTANYLVNGERFSLRATFLQNEAQLRSAGSFILGGGFSLFRIGADAALIPNTPQIRYFDEVPFTHSSVISGSVQSGYGYTQVLKKHFFITIAGTAGIGVNYSTLRENKIIRNAGWGTDIVGSLRMGLGYNSRLYFAGIHYQGSWQSSGTPILYARQQYGMGNWRLSLARRLVLRKKLLGFY